MNNIDLIIGKIWRSKTLMQNLETICAIGGRQAGTASEVAALEFLKKKLQQDHGRPATGLKIQGPSWQRLNTSLQLGDQSLECVSLSRSIAADDLTLEVVDLRRGDIEAFKHHDVAGKAVLVRHEYPFSTSHIHRRKKHTWARDAGAKAFIIANNTPGIGPVIGSAMFSKDGRNIPSMGISYEAGCALARRCHQGDCKVTMNIQVGDKEQFSENVVLDIPGEIDEQIVLCAHFDGHELAQSAVDNGAAVATVLEVARLIAPLAPKFKRGLRVMFFTFEEWALLGSEQYLKDLSLEERQKIRLAINLDTVVGGNELAALVNANEGLASFIKQMSLKYAHPVQPILPVMPNSDHFRFHEQGIPAFRLTSGFEEPDSQLRYILTPADTVDKVDPVQLKTAAMVTAALVYEACTAVELPFTNYEQSITDIG